MSTPIAMHMTDGLLDVRTSLLFAAVAMAVVGAALALARRDLDDRTAPMAGLVAAFIFAAQMINFPVLPGVSGHLLGGALAAILVGPWLATLSVTIVVALQALLFADGGLTALGANLTNMAIIGPLAGFAVALALRRLASRTHAGLLGVAFAAGFVATIATAAGFILQYAIGGQAAISLAGLSTAVFGVHVVIGVGEGVITALTIAAVAKARPDLVYLLRDYQFTQPEALRSAA